MMQVGVYMSTAVSFQESEADASQERPALSRTALRDVLATALRAGQLMLENGANTARIEETVHRMGTALGAEWMDVYVTPQGIIASAVSHHEHRTRIQRVIKSGVDLSRVAAVMDLSRRAEHGELTAEEALQQLEQIARQPRLYGVWATMLAVALACGGFAVLFGGGIGEFAVVLLAAGCAQLLRHSLLHNNLDRLMTTAVVAACASALALTIAERLPLLVPIAIKPATVITASVLLLVPGVLMVSSTADMVRGDITSGVARATAALLSVMSIGAGIWATLLVSRATVTLETVVQPNLLVALVMALLAAGGFGVLFDVPYRALPFAALTGMLAYGVRWLIAYGGAPIEVAFFFAGLTIGAMAELLARRLRTTSSLFAIPGYIPLVPGAIAFRAVLRFVEADYTAGLADAVRAVLLIIAIAVGLGTVSALTRMRQKLLF